MKTSHAGFSIVELVMALAIAAIAMAMVAPSMPLMSKNARMVTAHDSFVTALRYARMEALKLNTSVQMVSNAGGDWSDGWVVQIASDTTLLRTFPAIGGTITLKSANNVGTYTYNGAGYLTGLATDSVHICDSGRVDETGRELTLAAVGRVSANLEYTECH